MKDYRTKDVNGLIVDVRTMQPKPCQVTVRMTSDELGKSLSLSAFNVMIHIPLEGLEGIIQISEKRG